MPWSPVDARITVLGRSKCDAFPLALEPSDPPHEFETIVAPAAIAASSAAARFAQLGPLASISTILQARQIPRTAWTSRSISSPQPLSAAGNGLAVPCWL